MEYKTIVGNGHNLKAIVIAVEKKDIGTVFTMYCQNRLFKYANGEVVELLSDYCTIPEFDRLLEDISA